VIYNVENTKILYPLFTQALEPVIIGMPPTLAVPIASAITARSLRLSTTHPLRPTARGCFNGGRSAASALKGLSVSAFLPTRLAATRLCQSLRSEKGSFAFRKREIRTTVRANDHFIGHGGLPVFCYARFKRFLRVRRHPLTGVNRD
jgi:hypothetical protein